MLALAATLTDNTTWPGGKWPEPRTDTFDYATRLDGAAEWSVKVS